MKSLPKDPLIPGEMAEDIAQRRHKKPKSIRSWATFGQFVTERYRALQDHRPELVDQALLGGQLLTAKICLPKRKYVPWLRACTCLSQRTAARYISRWRLHMESKGWDPDLVIEDMRDLDESLKRREAAAQEKA